MPKAFQCTSGKTKFEYNLAKEKEILSCIAECGRGFLLSTYANLNPGNVAAPPIDSRTGRGRLHTPQRGGSDGGRRENRRPRRPHQNAARLHRQKHHVSEVSPAAAENGGGRSRGRGGGGVRRWCRRGGSTGWGKSLGVTAHGMQAAAGRA